MRHTITGFVFPILFLFCSLAAEGQAPGDRNRIGLRFGLTSSTLQANGRELYPDRMEQYYFGFYRESPFLAILKFKAGLQFLQIGARDEDFGHEVKLTYLSVPAAIKLKIGPFYAEAGAFGSLRIDTDEVANGRPAGSRDYDTFDGGYFFGAGAEEVAAVEFRQYYGRAGITDNYFSRYWQLGGGIRF